MHALTEHLSRLSPEHLALGTYVVGTLTLVALMLGLSFLLGGRAHGRAKQEPFESGVVSVGSARLRMPAKFYLVAMFFVIFDVEAVFLYAWAVAVRRSGWSGLAAAATFVLTLLIALVYLWRCRGLDWAPGSKRIATYRWLRLAGSTGPESRADASTV